MAIPAYAYCVEIQPDYPICDGVREWWHEKGWRGLWVSGAAVKLSCARAVTPLPLPYWISRN